MKIPVVTGDGRRLELDSDDFPRLVLLPDARGDAVWWDLFADEPYCLPAEQAESHYGHAPQ